MIIGIDKSGQNLGSSKKLFDYLDKENNGKKEEEKDLLFDQERGDISTKEATETIDKNIAKLGKEDHKFFSLHISPSADEIKTIGGDAEKMKGYVREVMDEYAKNFNKGLTGKDLVYFAKVERTRGFKNKDIEVKEGVSSKGTTKSGDQLHVHIVVSRKDKTNKIKLSIVGPSKGDKKFFVPGIDEPINKGFDRNKFFTKAEELFDKKFSYVRSPEDSYEYRRLQKHHPEEFKKKFEKNPAPKAQTKNFTDFPEFSKRNFAETHLNNVFKKAETPKEIDNYLAQRGIILKPDGVEIKGNIIPFRELILDKSSVDGINKYFDRANEKELTVSPVARFRKPTQTQRNQIEVKHVKNEFTKREYTEIHVNKILTNGQLKRQADSYLNEKGIKLTPAGAKVNGVTTPYKDLSFTKEAGEFLQAYYLTKKLGRNIEGKDEEKDKER